MKKWLVLLAVGSFWGCTEDQALAMEPVLKSSSSSISKESSAKADISSSVVSTGVSSSSESAISSVTEVISSQVVSSSKVSSIATSSVVASSSSVESGPEADSSLGYRYDIYNDDPGDESFPWEHGGNLGIWTPSPASSSKIVLDADEDDFIEGYKSLKVDYLGTRGAFYFALSSGKDFSKYQGGYLRFYYKGTTDFEIKIETSSSVYGSDTLSKYATLSGQWEDVTIPLAVFKKVNWKSVKTVATFASLKTLSETTVHIDQVRYIR